jgi:hypothetical protein
VHLRPALHFSHISVLTTQRDPLVLSLVHIVYLHTIPSPPLSPTPRTPALVFPDFAKITSCHIRTTTWALRLRCSSSLFLLRRRGSSSVGETVAKERSARREDEYLRAEQAGHATSQTRPDQGEHKIGMSSLT